MHIDLVSVLTSGLSVATLTFFAWLTRLGIVNQGQIRNLGDKIDHVEKNLESKIDHLSEKMDTYIKHTDEKMDAYIKHLDEKMDKMDQKIDRQDNEAKERITRLEKYFDVIMQTQIKKNGEQLKMEL